MQATGVSLAAQLSQMPTAMRPTIEAAIATVRRIAPQADERPYRSRAPVSSRTMWKIVRYSVAGANVIGIGTFPGHVTMFFYRGRELADGAGLLQGSGRDTRFVTLRTPADARRPAIRRLVRQAFALGTGA